MPDGETIKRMRVLAARLTPGVPVGSGTNANFTELNRDRPEPGSLDVACCSVNPQVHAFDVASLVETLPMQAVIVSSARQFLSDTPLVITPVSLKPRFNAVATGEDVSGTTGMLPAAVDVRQMTLFGAGWTLGSIKYLAESGLGAVTFYETTGWRGVMEKESGSEMPELFPSRLGEVFPLYHVLMDIGEWAGARLLSCTSDEPLKVEAMAMVLEGRVRLMMANYTDQTQRIRIKADVRFADMRRINSEVVRDAMKEPKAFRTASRQKISLSPVNELTLQPFEVVTLDGDL
jgi:hypothetical protein